MRALLELDADMGYTASGRDGRVVEGARLESVYALKRIAGSNPALSECLGDALENNVYPSLPVGQEQGKSRDD